MSQGWQQMGDEGGKVGLAQGGSPQPTVSEGEDHGRKEWLEGHPWAGTGLDRRGCCGPAGPNPWSTVHRCVHSAPSFPLRCRPSFRPHSARPGVLLTLLQGSSTLSSSRSQPTLGPSPSLPSPSTTGPAPGAKSRDSVPVCLPSGRDFLTPLFQGPQFPYLGSSKVES